jgi:hypothetical protein
MIKTSELTGAALDWAVAKCEGIDYGKDDVRFRGAYARKYSTDWAQAGVIIERESMGLWWATHYVDEGVEYGNHWYAEDKNGDGVRTGPTPLVAAMRCYVASKLGDTVEIPKELQ